MKNKPVDSMKSAKYLFGKYLVFTKNCIGTVHVNTGVLVKNASFGCLFT